MLTRSSLFFIVLFFLSARTVAQHPDLIPQPLRSLVAQLGDEDPRKRTRAAGSLRLQLRSLEQELIAIIDVEATTGYALADRRQLAAEVLADIGTHDALPVLVRHIENGPTVVAEEPPPMGSFPNALAVTRFGQTGVRAVLSYVRHTSSEKVSEKAMELYASIILNAYFDAPDRFASALRVAEESRLPIPENMAIHRLVARLKSLRDKAEKRRN